MIKLSNSRGKILIVTMLLFMLLLSSCTQPVEPAPAHADIKILVFSKTAGYRHDSISAGQDAILSMQEVGHFQVDLSDDADVFTPVNLEQYEAVVFLSTTGDILNSSQQSALEGYIRSGKGWVGVHSASDTEYSWPWYGGLVGAYFDSHPPGTHDATIIVEDKAHPASNFLPDEWARHDEWYNFDRNPRGSVQVLASLDENSYAGGNMGPDHPIAWCHNYDSGRSFYTAGGHTTSSYSEPYFLDHLLYGILWSAGKAEGQCTTTET